MNALANPFDAPATLGNGCWSGISNEAYHAADAASKSVLDMVATDPSMVPWSKAAPRGKAEALDMGTALHCRVLEPDEFKDRFIIAPEFNRRTTVGKADEKAFLEDCAGSGKTAMTAEEGATLDLMMGSVMAHPMARWILEQDGTNESSIFWTDEETGEACKCRPDRMLNDRPLIVDVKKVADIDRFERHVEEFRYYVQDAMYCDGYRQHFGETPHFWFLAISSTINCGRYPVIVRDLSEEWKEAGYRAYRRDLQTYHECRINNDWLHVPTLHRPYWAARKDQEV